MTGNNDTWDSVKQLIKAEQRCTGTLDFARSLLNLDKNSNLHVDPTNELSFTLGPK